MAHKALHGLAITRLLTAPSSTLPLIYCGPTMAACHLFSLPGLEWHSIFPQMFIHLALSCCRSLSTNAISAREVSRISPSKQLSSLPALSAHVPVFYFLSSPYHCFQLSYWFVTLIVVCPHPL